MSGRSSGCTSTGNTSRLFLSEGEGDGPDDVTRLQNGRNVLFGKGTVAFVTPDHMTPAVF